MSGFLRISDSGIGRRQFLAMFGVGVGTAALAGCSGKKVAVCAGPETLTRSDLSARAGRQYVEVSETDGKSCAGCTFFREGSGDCGVCEIDNLAANKAGHCISWAPVKA